MGDHDDYRDKYCLQCGRAHKYDPNCSRPKTESLLEAIRKDNAAMASGAIDRHVNTIHNFKMDTL